MDNLVKFWFGIATLLGAVFFLLLGVMDFFATPENFKRFLLYRLVVGVSLICLYFINKIIPAGYRSVLSTVPIIISATAIELMILDFGGHQSTYYVGLIILMVCVFGLIPLSASFSLIGISTVYVIYLFPILLFDTITDPRTFFTSNCFLLTFLIIATVWRYLNQKSIIRELSLQYDLENQKKQLEVYSLQLKGMVDDRTRELRKSEQWHRSIVDNATDGIIVQDRNGIIININDKACEMHGFPKEALIGTHIRLLENRPGAGRTGRADAEAAGGRIGGLRIDAQQEGRHPALPRDQLQGDHDRARSSSSSPSTATSRRRSGSRSISFSRRRWTPSACWPAASPTTSITS